MDLKNWLVFVIYFHVSHGLILYQNARFTPINDGFILGNVTAVYSQTECACYCARNTMCLTATYSGLRHDCTLTLARLDQGTLNVMMTSTMTSVLSFENKTLSGPARITGSNETIYGLWNTTTGSDSYLATPGLNRGNYPNGQDPGKAFDHNNTTKYVNFGVCDSVTGALWNVCGADTGLYLSLRREASLLLAFRFWAADSYPLRDPIQITIEASNCDPSILNLGSSWTLIYNGTSGMDIEPLRFSPGQICWLFNNSNVYSSYRVLIQSKRGEGNFVQYSELELFGN